MRVAIQVYCVSDFGAKLLCVKTTWRLATARSPLFAREKTTLRAYRVPGTRYTCNVYVRVRVLTRGGVYKSAARQRELFIPRWSRIFFLSFYLVFNREKSGPEDTRERVRPPSGNLSPIKFTF